MVSILLLLFIHFFDRNNCLVKVNNEQDDIESDTIIVTYGDRHFIPKLTLEYTTFWYEPYLGKYELYMYMTNQMCSFIFTQNKGNAWWSVEDSGIRLSLIFEMILIYIYIQQQQGIGTSQTMLKLETH